MIWLRFRAWLQEIDETSGGVGAVVFEEVRSHLGTAAAHAYGGFLAHLTAWAEANRSPTGACRSAPSSGTSPARATPTRRP